VQEIERSLQGIAGLTFSTRMHRGAHHGYALPDRDVYDHAAAEQDWADIFAMLQRQLA